MAVFGVKYRLGLINDTWKHELYRVMRQILSNMEGVQPILINGVNDHVHVLFSTNGFIGENEIVRKLKTESAMWVNKNRLTIGRFGWQRGAGRISYSYSSLPSVKRYITNQEEHHKIIPFREEFSRWMTNLGMKYNDYDLPDELID